MKHMLEQIEQIKEDWKILLKLLKKIDDAINELELSQLEDEPQNMYPGGNLNDDCYKN